MRGERDLDLFPVLYINDEDGDGDDHKHNPTKKMPPFGFETTSRPDYSGFLSSSSSNNSNGLEASVPFLVASGKRKMNECPHSGDWYNNRGDDEHTFPFHRLCHQDDEHIRQTTSPEGDEHTTRMFQIKETGPPPDKHTSAFVTTHFQNNEAVSRWGDEIISSYTKIYSSSSFPQHLIHLEQESKATQQLNHLERESKPTLRLIPRDRESKATQHVSHLERESRPTLRLIPRDPKSKATHLEREPRPTLRLIPRDREYSSPSTSQRLIHQDPKPKLKFAVKKEDFSNTCTLDQILSTDEVVKVIGPKLFLEARKTMIHQQKVFSWQTFELHRLITVQRLIARSPETIHPIKFPPMTKLLYVSPLDTSSSSPKTKTDAPKPEKGPNPGGWCFPPPPGNQWLIPVRSPSEGLVYKPYPGPCFPSIGIVNAMSGASYNVPAITDGEMGQSYFPGYPVPLINEVDKLFSELHKHKESERHALALFPTTPDEKVQVIKVVPYSRDSTPASTARILQSLQEGRKGTNQD